MASCFLCDKEVKDGIYVASSETYFTKTVFVTKISELMGNDFMVVAAEGDQLCKRCANLLNQSDKLEVDLMEIHNKIKRLIDFKYDLIPKEEHWNEPETDIATVENDLTDFEPMGLQTRNTTLSTDDENNESHLSQSNISELKEYSLTSELNINAVPGLVVQSEEILCSKPNLAKADNFQSEEITDKVKLEDCSADETYCVISANEISNRDEICQVNEDTQTYLISKHFKSNVEESSIIKNVKTDESIETNSKSNLAITLTNSKNKPILPKIVKSSDILKLAALGVFEPVDPSCIIKINKIEDNQPVEICILETSENVENETKEENTSVNNNKIQKKTLYKCQPFKCDVCGKECSTKNRLVMHKTIHEKKICDFCGRSFTSNYRLKVHRNIHTKQKMFTCNVCGEQFIHHSTYWYHRKWHDDPYPYSCEFCGKLFKHSSILAIHRRKHTGERPYKCSYCPLAFTISTTKKKHEMLHTSDFAFTCNVCPKGFTTRSKYVYHMARMHKILDQGGDEPKQQKKEDTIKSEKEETSKPSNINNYELVDINNTYEYFPLEFEEVVVGTEKNKRIEDIPIEAINQDHTQFDNKDQAINEPVAIIQNSLVEQGEVGVEIVLGPDQYVLSEEMIVSNI